MCFFVIFFCKNFSICTKPLYLWDSRLRGNDGLSKFFFIILSPQAFIIFNFGIVNLV